MTFRFLLNLFIFGIFPKNSDQSFHFLFLLSLFIFGIFPENSVQFLELSIDHYIFASLEYIRIFQNTNEVLFLCDFFQYINKVITLFNQHIQSHRYQILWRNSSNAFNIENEVITDFGHFHRIFQVFVSVNIS